MTTEIVTVSPDATVEDLAELLREQGVSGVPVVEADRVVGVVSDSDILRLAVEEGGFEDLLDDRAAAESGGYFGSPLSVLSRLGRILPEELPRTRLGAHSVHEIMTSATFTVRPEATLEEAARFLTGANVHRALVFDEGRLVGVITTFDVLKGLAAD